MKRVWLLGLMVMPVVVAAQTDAAAEYNRFRSQMMADYDAYKKEVLDEYANYLDGVWKDYKAMAGEKKDVKPKPVAPPTISADTQRDARTEPTVTLPAVDANTRPVTAPEPKPVVNPTPQISPFPQKFDMVKTPTPAPAPTSVPVTTPVAPVTSVPVTPAHSNTPQCEVSFYNQTVRFSIIDEDLSGVTVQNLGTYWSKLQKNKLSNVVVEELKQAARSFGLNDWLTFKLAEAYAMQYKRTNSTVAQTLVAQYLASHLGFDVRLARSGSNALLLIPFKQMVYECNYVTLNSEKLYIYGQGKFMQTASLSTCDMPNGAKLGAPLDLKFNHSLNLKGEKRPFEVSHSGITLTGQIDLTQMEIVSHYPQMEVVEYAKSTLDKPLRDDVCAQIKSQLNGLSHTDAVNKLLSFTQYGFEYATDDEQHGREKPYFFEELFYYPKCDCEDRSVFLAYLVKEVLDIDNVLVRFPGHKCVAVLIKEYSGDGFLYNNARYTITDPTYMGAKMGQCMTNYKSEKPVVEEWY